MSAKLRVTLWFTLMMLLLVAVVLVFLLVIDSSAVPEDPVTWLVKVVSSNADDVEFDRGAIEWDDLDFYRNGVYLSYNGADGTFLNGALPTETGFAAPFANGVVQTETVDGVNYCLYDLYVDMSVSGLWVRGAIDENSSRGVMHTILVLTVTILPALLALSVGGGWLIARGAFRPMERMMTAVDGITGGDDLSKRTALRRGPREMVRLSRTFDGMLERLEKSFRAEKQFTSDASHELRTPLAVILAQCERAERKDETREDFLSSLSVIREQGERMTELADELLSLTRLEQGTDKYPLRRGDLSGFVAGCAGEFVPREARDIAREMEIQEGVEADFNPALLSRVVYNLLENAYKYGREGGHVRLTLTARDGEARLSVRDDGIGIPPEEQPKIWQRFWQADAARGQEGGSGLGLAMVKEIARFHGGDASVESAVGQGSCFTVTLPLKKS